MRRAHQTRTATHAAAATQRTVAPQVGTVLVPLPDNEALAGSFAVPVVAPAQSSERSRGLAFAVQQRIESRLPGRIRHLVVQIVEDSVVLSGECSTYYTKQLAQHAALGILEDEHLENAIVVSVAR
jgi:hypothetical protein